MAVNNVDSVENWLTYDVVNMEQIHRNIEYLILALVVCVLLVINGNEATCPKRIVLQIYPFVNYL